MFKVKLGAITKEVPEGALKWYKMAGWKIIKSNKSKKEDKKDETNSKEITST